MNCWAIIVAAGKGTRSGLKQNKVFFELDGRSILARCLDAFQGSRRFDGAVLVLSDEDEWVFQLEGDSADLDDIITTTLVLNMDSKLLCKPDCQGLCCRCGANLNDGPCNCEPELDPRFAALKQLLKDKEF